MTGDFENSIVNEGDGRYVRQSHTWFHPWRKEEVTCEYLFRQPTQPEINRYTKETAKGGSIATANQNLLVSIVHDDDKARLVGDIREFPGLSTALANWVMKASGFADLGN